MFSFQTPVLKQERNKSLLLEEEGRLYWLRLDEGGVMYENCPSGVEPFIDRVSFRGSIWFCRRHIVGQTFSDVLKNRSFQMNEYLRLMMKLRDILQSLHNDDMLHGNIDADNLIYSYKTRSWVWVDPLGLGSKERDHRDFVELFLSAAPFEDVAWRYFRFLMEEHPHEDILGEVVEESRTLPVEHFGAYLLSAISLDEIVATYEDTEAENHIRTVAVHERLIQEEASHSIDGDGWEEIFLGKRDIQDVARAFLSKNQASYEQGYWYDSSSLLLAICDAIEKGSLTPKRLKRIREGIQQSAEFKNLTQKENHVKAAKKWALVAFEKEQQLTELESNSWFGRSFGALKEEHTLLEKELSEAIIQREKRLSTLLPNARGLLEAEQSLRAIETYEEHVVKSLSDARKKWYALLPEASLATPLPSSRTPFSMKQFRLDDASWHMSLLPSAYYFLKRLRVVEQFFWMAKTPVSQALYQEVMGVNPSARLGAELPVEMVSWTDAIHFCNALSTRLGKEPYYLIEGDGIKTQGNDGFRLPTEEEWMYVAQSNRAFPSAEQLQNQAWFWGNAEGKSHPVAQKEANEWGFYDMLGNVEEWCWDPLDNGNRIRKGGSWYQDEKAMRYEARSTGERGSCSDSIGIRICYTELL
ncbi:MAG: SUMF1/EgtB/PvdO family nonheme iron enzyme [Myxococcota bacterium]|nr:SUMF1/EgtB/PvdO family nonheme iron enzyme [Myxococcota bacterium]